MRDKCPLCESFLFLSTDKDKYLCLNFDCNYEKTVDRKQLTIDRADALMEGFKDLVRSQLPSTLENATEFKIEIVCPQSSVFLRYENIKGKWWYKSGR